MFSSNRIFIFEYFKCHFDTGQIDHIAFDFCLSIDRSLLLFFAFLEFLPNQEQISMPFSQVNVLSSIESRGDLFCKDSKIQENFPVCFSGSEHNDFLNKN